MNLKTIFNEKRNRYSRPSIKTTLAVVFAFLFIFTCFPSLDAGDKVVYIDGELYTVTAQSYWTGVLEVQDTEGNTFKYKGGKKW